MPRPRAFKIDDVLTSAMEVFWRKGYVASSLSDIYEATGLKPGNLYANFKDKDALFRRAFETYGELFRRSLPKDATGRAAIEGWLFTQASLAIEDPDRKGCLIVNTIMEREAHSEETRALAQARLAEIKAFFLTHVEGAVAGGELSRDTDPGRLSDALVGTVVAIMSLGRAGAGAAVISHIAEEAIADLDRRAPPPGDRS